MRDVIVIGGGPAGSTAATQERFGLQPVIVGLLAGNVFSGRQRRIKFGLFFALVAIQKRRKVIADPIAWDALPAAASV